MQMKYFCVNIKSLYLKVKTWFTLFNNHVSSSMFSWYKSHLLKGQTATNISTGLTLPLVRNSPWKSWSPLLQVRCCSQGPTSSLHTWMAAVYLKAANTGFSREAYYVGNFIRSSRGCSSDNFKEYIKVRIEQKLHQLISKEHYSNIREQALNLTALKLKCYLSITCNKGRFDRD